MTHNLVPYTIRFWSVPDGSYLNLGKKFDPFPQFVGDLQKLVQSQKPISVLTSTKQQKPKGRSFRVDKLQVSKKHRTVSGLIRAGGFGTGFPIINRRTGRTKYNQAVDDAGMPPYYFLIHFLATGDKIPLILERNGGADVQFAIKHLLSINDILARTKPVQSYDLVRLWLENGIVKRVLLSSVKRRDDSRSFADASLDGQKIASNDKVVTEVIRRGGFQAFTDSLLKKLRRRSAGQVTSEIVNVESASILFL